ncbi:MAG: ABC transporter ATP-binding protein [Pseudomonadota bacterium]
MAGIRLDKLQKTFARQTAVAGLDLDIDDGELLVLLGPSGCGKTTTLNCIAGLETPSQGRVLFNGEDVTALPPHARNIAMVFQSSLLYPHMSARQNILTSLRRGGLSRADQQIRVDETASILSIGHLLDKLPSQLSGGERQRVATAKAIVRHPTAFLLDEPLAALDAALRLTLRSELVNLQKRLATTMVFVTHDQTEAMTMGDRVAVMNGGKLDQIGTPEEIYNQPSSLFVAGFIGAPPMNLIEGEIAEGTIFRKDQLRVPVENLTIRSKKVVLGVRPQHMSVSREPLDNSMPLAVFALEHLGRETVVIMEDESQNKIRALVEPGYMAKVGSTIFARPDPTHCLLFEPE